MQATTLVRLEVGALHLRIAYFENRARHRGREMIREARRQGWPYAYGYPYEKQPTETTSQPPDAPTPDLTDAAAAIYQVDEYLASARLLSQPDWSEFFRSPAGSPLGLTRSERGPELIRIEMGSPLQILLHLSPAELVSMGVGLLLLAERICTMGPRVSRKRKEELFKAAVYDKAREDVLRGRADSLALELLNDDRNGLPRPRPDYVDFVDPEAEDDEELESVEILSDASSDQLE